MSGPTAKAAANSTSTLTPAEQAALHDMIRKSNPEDVLSIVSELHSPTMKSMEGMRMSSGEPMVEDLWDGEPDGMPSLMRIMRGASGAHRGNRIPVGRPMSASGDGAPRMQEVYSPDIASQIGVAEATQAFGEMFTMMNRMAKAIKSLSNEIMTVKAVMKSSEERREREEEEDEKKRREEAKAVAPKTASETAEKEEDDEDEKAASAFLTKARTSLEAAGKLIQRASRQDRIGKSTVAGNLRKQAYDVVAKATSHYNAAVALADTHPGIDSVEDLFAALYKSVPATEAAAFWPAGFAAKSEEADEGDKERDGGEEVASSKAADVDISAVITNIEKALTGVSMLSTDLRGFMDTMSRQSRSATPTPPVYDLAKSTQGGLTAQLAAIAKGEADGVLSRAEADYARETAHAFHQAAQHQIPRNVPESRLRNAPPSVQSIFQAAA
jgi:hypothetical protein